MAISKSFLTGTIAITAVAFAALPAHAAALPTEITECRGAPSQEAQISCLENAIKLLKDISADVDTALDAGANANANKMDDVVMEGVAVAETGKLAEAEEPTGLGAEQVRARTKRTSKDKSKSEPRSEVSRIIETARTGDNKLIVILENGQVWREKSGNRQKVRLSSKKSYSAKIEEGFLSGYKLTIPEAKRTIKVERIK